MSNGLEKAAENAYINYLADVEGVRTNAYDSLEGGNQTIGIGHKLTDQEVATGKILIGGQAVDYSKGLSMENVRTLKMQDLQQHKQITSNRVNNKYGKGTFEKLPAKSKYFLTDYQLNIGNVMKFPKMVDAVVKGDWESVNKQYKRFYKNTKGETVEMTRRNRKIYERYIEPELMLNQMKKADNPLGY
tara:strand:+ start:43 stop:606 length:564 start_codon:yes stop_codon:yes gene_type:complete